LGSGGLKGKIQNASTIVTAIGKDNLAIPSLRHLKIRTTLQAANATCHSINLSILRVSWLIS
jgi:hypothetical protein